MLVDFGVIAVAVGLAVAGEVSLRKAVVAETRESLGIECAEAAGHELELLPGEDLVRVDVEGAGDGVEAEARIRGALDDLDALELERKDGAEIVVAVVEIVRDAVDHEALVRGAALAVEAAHGDIGGDDALVEVGEIDAGNFVEQFQRVVDGLVFELVGADDGHGREQVGGLRAEFRRGDLVATEGHVGAAGRRGGRGGLGGGRERQQEDKREERKGVSVGFHGDGKI